MTKLVAKKEGGSQNSAGGQGSDGSDKSQKRPVKNHGVWNPMASFRQVVEALAPDLARANLEFEVGHQAGSVYRDH